MQETDAQVTDADSDTDRNNLANMQAVSANNLPMRHEFKNDLSAGPREFLGGAHDYSY